MARDIACFTCNKILGLIPISPNLKYKKATLKYQKDDSKIEKLSTNYISNKVYRNSQNLLRKWTTQFLKIGKWSEVTLHQRRHKELHHHCLLGKCKSNHNDMPAYTLMTKSKIKIKWTSNVDQDEEPLSPQHTVGSNTQNNVTTATDKTLYSWILMKYVSPWNYQTNVPRQLHL